MPVGTTTLTCYEDEDVTWDFTVTDANVSSIAGWTIVLKIKASAADGDPALITQTCSITGTLTFRAAFNIALAPGPYVYGVRRTNVGFAWELATAPVIVLDTPSSII
jgi:hypothetical protein